MSDKTVEILVDNVPQVIADLDRKVETALTVCGGKIEGYAVDLCPVGTEESTGIKGYKGGSLRSTIRYELDKDGDSVAIGAGGIDGIYRFVDYAKYVELGTYKMRAQPYLRPALEDHQNEIKAVIEKVFKG